MHRIHLCELVDKHLSKVMPPDVLNAIVIDYQIYLRNKKTQQSLSM